MSRLLGHQPGAVLGLVEDVVTSTRLAAGQRLGALQPGQIDQFADQPAEAGALALHARGEASDGLRIVGRVLHGLGQQGERTDRRLQLVRHVGDEVPADLLEPARFGDVVE